MAHDAEWHARRRLGVGGSDANTLMGGDAEKIHRLWLEKLERAEPEDLTWVLPVQMGVATEDLNAAFCAHTTGRDIGDRHSQRTGAQGWEWMRCELDGMTTTQAGEPAVWEAKHVNPFATFEDVAARYRPQLHHNMHIVGVKHAVLSVFFGTQKHEILEVELDDEYMLHLLHVERRFWDCVKNDTPPEGFVAINIPFDTMKVANMATNKDWALAASDWVRCRSSAQQFDLASKALRKLVAPDVRVATGHGVQVKRSRSGALLITAE